MKNEPRRRMVFIWIFLAIVFVGFAAYSLSLTPDSDTTESSAAAETAQPQPEPTESSNDEDQLFHGIACEPDCADQEQGYSDAQSSNVKSRDDCPTGPQTVGYREGCWAYADEQANANNPSDQSVQSNPSDQSDQGSP